MRRSTPGAIDMQLVDTNVLAYLLIDGDQTAAAHSLFERDGDWVSEAFVIVEFSNILCTYVRAKALSSSQGAELLDRATKLMPALPAVEHGAAFESAVQYGLSAYDGRFIALAKQMKAKLVTGDRKLLAAVPQWTIPLEQAASRG
jgi:predicted nucleic acid-binding protein